jgi:hypothetical protein
MSLTTLLLGRRLANREALGRKIGTFEGLPAMGLDGLGSASYGPEAMLTILGGVGVAGLAAVQPITWVILALLAILFLSYWQTIAAYPSNGGCYTVARENLGETAGLLGAAALMVDYMLNVTVGICAAPARAAWRWRSPPTCLSPPSAPCSPPAPGRPGPAAATPARSSRRPNPAQPPAP